MCYVSESVPKVRLYTLFVIIYTPGELSWQSAVPVRETVLASSGRLQRLAVGDFWASSFCRRALACPSTVRARFLRRAPICLVCRIKGWSSRSTRSWCLRSTRPAASSVADRSLSPISDLRGVNSQQSVCPAPAQLGHAPCRLGQCRFCDDISSRGRTRCGAPLVLHAALQQAITWL